MADLEEKRAQNRDYMRRLRESPARKASERESSKRARLRDPLPFMLRAARMRAAKQGVPFDLTIEWMRSRYTGACELTGLAFVQTVGGIGTRSPSLDRIRGGEGYTQGNCRFILSALNGFKGSGTDEEMLAIAVALVGGLSWRT